MVQGSVRSRWGSGGPGLGQVALGVSVVPGARGSHWGSRWSRGLGGRTGGLGGHGGSGVSVVLGGMNDKQPEP